LRGVVVYQFGNDELKRGVPQEVLVDVAPNREIPLHAHAVDAEMFIVGGSGTVLSADAALDGRHVTKGMVVIFEKEILHGFRAGADGLTFVSRNGGIVAETAENWDLTFPSA
jgi:quercetin dioxygenase-like cupin family protein